MKRLFSAALIFSSISAFFHTSALASLPSSQSASATPDNLTLSWSSVSGAEQYRVEEKVPGGEWAELGTGNFLSFDISTSKADGDYQYRVVGCLVTPYDGLLKCAEVAEYSAPYTITFPFQATTPLAPVNVEIAGQPASVSANTVTNDTTSEEIGVMAGQFRVDESGAATYQIPLTIPDGIAGTSPQLALNYSSASGNGALGMGWSISGQSAISRCRRTQEQDNENLHLTMSNDDRFCLDGQKLVAVSGDYGANDTEYRTEIDTRVRVKSFGTLGNGPSYFTVEREDGSVSYYGNRDRQGTRSDATLTADSTGVVWHLTSITDNLDNTSNSIRFFYTKNQTGFGQNEILLDEVTYSGNTVEFNYDTNSNREDVRTAYVYGALVESTALLKSVEVSNHDNIEVRSYNLEYDIDTISKVQRIDSIEECGMGGSSCLPATTFDWNNQPAYVSGGVTQKPLGSEDISAPVPVDLDGDGFTDFAYIRKASSDNFDVYVSYNDQSGALGESTKIFRIVNDQSLFIPNKLIPSDVDGDGRVELVYYTLDGAGFRWKYYDFNDTNVQEIKQCYATANCTVTSQVNHIVDMNLPMTMNSTSKNEILLHDFNGDAYPDIVLPGSRILNDGTGHFPGPAVQTNLAIIASRQQQPVVSSSLVAHSSSSGEEYEGDVMTLAEALFKNPDTEINTGNRTDTLIQGNSAVCPPGTIIAEVGKAETLPSSIPPTDFNGDGVADLVVRMANERVIRTTTDTQTCPIDMFWAVYTLEKTQDSEGNYSAEPRYKKLHWYPRHMKIESSIFSGDINGDGLGDLLHPPADNEGSVFSLSYSTGAGMTPLSPITMGADAEDITGVQILDINKDGRADIVYFDEVQKRWEVNYQNNSGGFSVGDALYTEYNFDKDQTLKDIVFLTDWNGNGEIGFSRIELDNKRLYHREDAVTQKAANRIRRITNGFGVKTDIDYGLMTDTNVYRKGSGADDLDYGNGSPVFDLISPQPLVSRVTSDAPAYVDGTYDEDNTLSVDYFYEGMRIQSGGRGSLGFEKLYTYDLQRGITTETTYHQDFPLTGMPRETLQYLGARTDSPAANKRLSHSVSTYTYASLNNGKTVFPYLDKSDETMYAVNDAGNITQFKSRVITDNVYTVANTEGSHANLTRVDVVTKNTNDASLSSFVSKVTTTNQYDVDYGESNNEWWLGRVTDTSVSHQRPNQTTLTRSSEFEYYPENDAHAGMLKSEKVMTPSGMTASESELITHHCYDTKGNKTQTLTHNNQYTMSNCTLSSVTEPDLTEALPKARKVLRYQQVNFDAAGRYSTSKQNADFIESTINSRNALGQATKSTDINGVETYVWFDAFGRQYGSANSVGQKRVTRRALASSVDGTALGAPELTSFDTDQIYFVERMTQAGAPTQYYYYDALGRKVGQAVQGFGEDHILQTTKYDQYGRVIAQSNPYYPNQTPYFTTTVYDDFDRPQSILASSGTSTVITYANSGLSTTSVVTFNDINQGGNSTQSKTEVMNVLGENVSITDEAGTVAYEYDVTGNLTKVTGVDDVEIITQFDALGRKTSMTDPDKGTWTYRYNALGELIQQTDARGATTRFFRDRLGRTVERAVSGSGISEHTNYDFVDNLLQHESFTSGNTLTKSLIYDEYGRQTLLRSTLDNGVTYTSQTTYDQYGRVFQQFDADGANLNGCIHNGSAVGACWGVKNNYNANGYLLSQEEARYSNGTANKAVYQKVNAMDAFGNVTELKQNNDVITYNRVYDRQTGLIETIQTSNGTLIQDNDYQFDNIGNLRSRTRNTLANTATISLDGNALSVQNESFQYDDVNRLTHIDGTEFVRYQANGNIDWKRGIGNYCYNAARPHAVSGLGSQGCSTQSYVYDANGNMTNGRGRTLAYGHFDKPTLISNSAGSTEFAYDTARNRYKRITTEDNADGVSVTTTTYYLGNVEIVSDSQGKNEVRRYLPNAIQTQHGTGVISTKYLHKDHLGSIDTITDENGKVLDKLYFDAWGKKVSIDSLQWSNTAQLQAANTLINVLDITPRGFTGHEHVDHADIIHMNGRIYDPTLGRFLQADPHIQAPQNSQSYNRYAYVLNNPLSFTDPSGYFFNKLFKGFKKLAGAVAGILVAAYCNWCALGPLNAALTGAAIGAGSAALNGGNIFKGALIGAFSGAVFNQVGEYFRTQGFWNQVGIGHGALDGATLSNFGGNLLSSGQIAAQIASHAIAGGVISTMQGGKFGHGFFSAGVTKGLSGKYLPAGTNLGGKEVARGTVVSAIIGGTASVISGGKFANGARTATYQYLFNQAGNSFKRMWESFRKSMTIIQSELPKYVSSSVDGDPSLNYLKNNADLSIDLHKCVIVCIAGEAELTDSYGLSLNGSLISEYGFGFFGGAGSDIALFNSQSSLVIDGSVTPFRAIQLQLGPIGVSSTRYDSFSGQHLNTNIELNLRFPGGIGAAAGSGVKKW